MITASGAAHLLDPRDEWRAWFTDAHGLYRWSRRGWHSEREADEYGRKVVLRWRRIFGKSS